VLALPRAGHARPAVREKGDQLHIRGSPARAQPQRTLNTGRARAPRGGGLLALPLFVAMERHVVLALLLLDAELRRLAWMGGIAPEHGIGGERAGAGVGVAAGAEQQGGQQ